MNDDFRDPTIQKAIDAAEKGYIHSAQVLLNEAAEKINTPELHTYLAYCLAKGEGRMHSAARSCRESIKREPGNSLHYLILGRILLMAGEKKQSRQNLSPRPENQPEPKNYCRIKKIGAPQADCAEKP